MRRSQRDADPPCPGEVCRDGRGFLTRDCPGCGGRKARVRTLAGYEADIPASAARAYWVLLDSLDPTKGEER